MLVTRDGVFRPLLNYFLAPRNLRKSRSWQRSVTRAVGLLYDFVIQRRPANQDETALKRLLSDFAEALLCGTIGVEGDDPTELYWPSLSFSSAKTYIRQVTDFSDFCVEQYDSEPLNPWTAAHWGERIAAMRRWDARNRGSLLKHISDQKTAWAQSMRRRSVDLGYPPKGDPLRPPYFPPDRFQELICEGFRIRGREHPLAHRQRHLRDAMIAILQGAGGLRESEAFHLFLDDVHEDKRYPGHALVRVHHPEYGKVSYPDPLIKKIVRTSRGNYLRGLGLSPRHRVGERRFVAGWKDPLLVKAKASELYMEVHWFPTWWGEVFWQLYRAYIFHIRPSTQHPFLFVSKFGEPYTIQQYNKKLARAVRRIGLVPAKDNGTSSHGLRHMYGQLLQKCNISEEIRQKCMHHKSPESTAIYTKPEAEYVDQVLRMATASLRQATLSDFLSP